MSKLKLSGISPFPAMLMALFTTVVGLYPLGFSSESWEVVVVLGLIAACVVCAVWGHEAISQTERDAANGRNKRQPVPYSSRGKIRRTGLARTGDKDFTAVPIIPIALGFLLTLVLLYAVAVFSF